MDFTLTSVRVFPAGTLVYVYLRADFPLGVVAGVAPTGAAVTSGTMTDTGVTFSGLSDDTSYVAGAQVGGVWCYVTFATPAPDATGGFDEAADYAPSGTWTPSGSWTFSGSVDLSLADLALAFLGFSVPSNDMFSAVAGDAQIMFEFGGSTVNNIGVDGLDALMKYVAAAGHSFYRGTTRHLAIDSNGVTFDKNIRLSKRAAITGTTTLASSAEVLVPISSAAARTITLPAVSAGRWFIFYDHTPGTGLATNNATINRAGSAVINSTAAAGATSYTCNVTGGAWLFWSDGTDWFVQRGA